MFLFDQIWFLVLLAVLCAGGLLLLVRLRPAYRLSVMLMTAAPMLLLGTALWGRAFGPREVLALTVERFLPAAIELDQLPALPVKAEDPDVMMVMLGVGGPKPLLGFLHAHGSAGFRREEPQGRFAVLYRETLEEALRLDLKQRPPAIQRLSAKYGPELREVPAEPGQRLEIAGCTLRVVAVYPDFEVKPDANGQPMMGSRSAEPRDPWLELECFRPHLSPKRVLLSAFRPELTHGLNAPNLPEGLALEFVRDGEERQSRFVVFTRKDQRITLVEQGAVVRSEALAVNRPFVVLPGASVTPLGLFDRFHPAPGTAGDRAAVRLRVEDQRADGTERAWLRPGEGSGMPALQGRFTLSLVAEGAKGRGLALEVRGADAGGRSWPPRRQEVPTQGRTVRMSFQRPPTLGFVVAAFLLLLGGLGWLLATRARLRHAE